MVLTDLTPPLGPSPRPMQVNDYNVPGGKLNRGMAVYDVLASIKGAEVNDAHTMPTVMC